MGCIASKLNNDDTVRRCRERRRFMKEAVCARHHLAAAHADYFRSLRITASALSLFAAGEPLSVSDQTPAVFLHTPPPHFSDIPVPPRVPSPSPPPPPAFSPPASSISSSVSQRRQQQQQRRRKPPQKLPHILSESSLCNSPRSHKSNLFGAYPDSTFSTTPSQASSSVWNWENFHPPSPPDSEFFQIRTEAQAHTRIQTQNLNRQREFHNLDEESEPSEYDFFHQKSENQNKKHDIDDTEIEREEVQCSEWEGHNSISSSSDSEGGNEERDLRSEIGSRSNYEPSIRGARSVGTDSVDPPPPTRYPSKSEKFDEWGSSAGSYRPGEILDMKMVIRHKDLKEIVDAIKEYFEKAASAGDGVSELLEIGRAQLDRNFSQLKSKRTFSVI